jgi:hypothetical protein
LAFVVTACLVGSRVVWPIYKETGKWPPLNATVSLVSGWLWLQPWWTPFGFQLFIIQIAHSVQYLSFVYRVEKNDFSGLAKQSDGDEKKPAPSLKPNPLFYAALVSMVIFVGFLGFQAIPDWLDREKFYPFLTANFFLIAAAMLLNVHHQVIDGVVWRAKKSRVRSLLMKPATQ